MPSNRTKYSDEMREETAKFIIESGKSATSVAEEMGIDTNTVCRWVRDYRRKNNMPSYKEEKGIGTKDSNKIEDESFRIKVQEREIRKLKKELQEEKIKVDILKKSLRIFMEQSD
jgi:transposase-like protein